MHARATQRCAQSTVPSERGPQRLADPSLPHPPAATLQIVVVSCSLTSGDDCTPLDCRVDCVDILLRGMYRSAMNSLGPSSLNLASQPRRISVSRQVLEESPFATDRSALSKKEAAWYARTRRTSSLATLQHARPRRPLARPLLPLRGDHRTSARRFQWLGYITYNLLMARFRVQGFACVPCLSRPTVPPTSLPTDAPSSGPTFAPTARFAHAFAHGAVAFNYRMFGSCGTCTYQSTEQSRRLCAAHDLTPLHRRCRLDRVTALVHWMVAQPNAVVFQSNAVADSSSSNVATQFRCSANKAVVFPLKRTFGPFCLPPASTIAIAPPRPTDARACTRARALKQDRTLPLMPTA